MKAIVQSLEEKREEAKRALDEAATEMATRRRDIESTRLRLDQLMQRIDQSRLHEGQWLRDFAEVKESISVLRGDTEAHLRYAPLYRTSVNLQFFFVLFFFGSCFSSKKYIFAERCKRRNTVS